MDELIIAVGLNENVSRVQSPKVPITASEIAGDVAACADAGATVFHAHARDERTGEPILADTDQYVRIFEAVRARCDVFLYPSYPTVEKEDRFRHVVALLEAGLLEVGPIITGSTNLPPADLGSGAIPPDGFVLRQGWDDIAHQMEVSRKHDVWISHDVLEPGGMRAVDVLHRMGWYQHPPLLKFFLSESRAFGMPAQPRFLEAYTWTIPPGLDCEWLVLPYGCSHPVATALWEWAIRKGGHVRVGVGDNPAGPGYLPTNADRVREIAARARALGRRVATVDEVRARFGARL